MNVGIQRGFHDLTRDATYAARQLRRNPLFGLTAVLTLAIAIGANTAVFTLANALLFSDPVGVQNPASLVDIGVSVNGSGFGADSYPNYVDISRYATSFEGVYAHPRFPTLMTLKSGDNGSVERVFASQVTANYFNVLGALPAAGRLFLPAKDASGGPLEVVLSHRFWMIRFQKNPAIIGRTLRLNDRLYDVVGVAAEGFQGTGVRAPDLWVPLRGNSNRLGATLLMGARVKTGVSLAQARAELDSIGRGLEQQYPLENRGQRLRVAPLSRIPGETAPVALFLLLLTGIVLTVLATACANISTALLARGIARAREIAVRLAIGAGPARIVKQILTETALLFAISIAAGVWMARGMTSLLVSQLPSLPFPIGIALSLDLRVIAFAVIVSFSAALASGLAPAIQASRSDLVSGLKDHIQGGLGRLRQVFVIGQVALSLLLVIVGGLFLRALQHVAVSEPGYEAKGIEAASINLSLTATNQNTPSVARTLVDRVRAFPNVESATAAAVLPGGFEGIGLGSLARSDTPQSDALSPVWNTVEPGYFSTLRMQLLEGRDFTREDREGSAPVIILGEGAARKLWPGQKAVGSYVQQTSWRSDGTQNRETLLVVGVVGDPKIGSLVDGTSGLYAYAPIAQQFLPGWPFMLAARSRNGGRLISEMQATANSVLPDLPAVPTQSALEYAEIGLFPQRIAAMAASGLGMVGLLLAAMGVYGITAHGVTRRTREIGVRVALGASRGEIVRLVLWNGMKPVAVGSAIGLLLAAGMSQVLAGFLFNLSPVDPQSFGGAAALFIASGLIACYLPVRRAVRIAAVEALRYE